MGKKKAILIIILLVVIVLSLLLFLLFIKDNKKEENNNKIQVLENIKSHYNQYVVTNKEAKIYKLENNKYEEVGCISKDIELELLDINIDENTKYFQINMEELKYYIYYEDVDVTNNITTVSNRYKNYIVFNKSIITNDITNFYDENNNLVYKLNKSYTLPIIIMDNDKYGVEFNNRLLYIKVEDVKEVIDSNNTDLSNSSGVGVLNYHAFYDESNAEEKANCTTEICHSKEQFKTHLDYFKENNILTITTNELEMYIDGKLQLPKSVLITIDDGPKTEVAIDLLEEYKMYATIFLVTSWFNVDEYTQSEYIELHSHTHNMHDGGKCPGGQGGAIKCLPEEEILADLKASRDALNGSTVFCYPFYEYNDYAINLVKEAGFTMAFIGESNFSDNLVHVGSDKFKLRRFVIVTYTTMDDLDKYFNQIK